MDTQTATETGAAPERGRRVPVGRGVEPREQERVPWAWMLALGVALVVIGVLALASLGIATLASVLVFGAFVLVAGVVQIALAFAGRCWRGAGQHLIMGVLGGIVGVYLLARPLMAATVLTLLLAAWLLVTGIGEIISAVSQRHERWGWAAAAGVASAVLGLLLAVQWPEASLWFIGLYVGIYLLVHGAMWIGLALDVRRLGRPGGAWRPARQPA